MITCFVNRKGGVGKSALTYQGGSTLAQGWVSQVGGGIKTLLVDTDAQASLSQILFNPTWVEGLPKARSIAALFDASCDPTPEQLIYSTSIPNLSLLPASDHLTAHNTPVQLDNINITADLAPFLHELRGEYDHILIDCAPNIQHCTVAALLASDHVVVPAIAESPSTQGLIYVQGAIAAAQRCNPRLRLAGYLLTLHNKFLAVHKTFEKMLRQQYGDLVFEHPMPLSAAIKESIARRQPITSMHTKAATAAAEAMKAIVAELLDRTATPLVTIPQVDPRIWMRDMLGSSTEGPDGQDQ